MQDGDSLADRPAVLGVELLRPRGTNCKTGQVGSEDDIGIDGYSSGLFDFVADAV